VLDRVRPSSPREPGKLSTGPAMRAVPAKACVPIADRSTVDEDASDGALGEVAVG
jgi:hypothetical protein